MIWSMIGVPARGVEILHELLETLLRIEVVVDVFAVLVLAALVRQVQVYSLVQERQLAQTVGQNFVFVFGREREDAAVGLEGDGGAPVGALADDLDLRGGRAPCCSSGGKSCRRGCESPR